VTVGGSLMFALMSAAMAISVGTTALVARFIGEKTPQEAERATQQSLLLAFLVAVVVAALMWMARGPLLSAMGLQAGPRQLAIGYLNWVLLGLPSLFTMLILNGAFRGMGDTVRPLWVSLGANLVHAGGNWLLIFGNLGFPRMGLPGGALALVISQAVAVGLYVFFLRRSPLRGALRRRGWRLDPGWSWRIARIGLPASAQQLIRVGSMLVFQGMLARTSASSAAVAALGVGLVSESIAFMPGFGYAIAASAFVGQNLGARQVRRAHNGAWSATWQAVLIMTVMGAVFWTFAEPFARLFVHTERPTLEQRAQIEETVRLTVAYLRIAAWSEPFLALGMVLTGALQGAGETVSPTALTVFTMVAIRLPLAWLLMNVFGLGAVGGWYAIAGSTLVQGLLTVLVFRRGRWRHIRV
jgi:putative MATE family efflux protein